MADFPTRTDLFEIFADEVTALDDQRNDGRHFSREELFTPGSDINLIGAAASAMGEECIRQTAVSVRDLTLDGARGAALDRYVADRYSTQVVRRTASAALVALTFARTSTAAGAVVYPAGSIVATAGGVRFVTEQSASFGISDTEAGSVSAHAVAAGVGGLVAANTITQFVTPPPDATMTVTNETFSSGGDDTEGDARLRERARQFYVQARRGTLGAIEFGALTVAGVRQATAIEGTDTEGEPNGDISLFIADANGQANALLIELARRALLEYRCGGVVVRIFGSVPVYQTITYLLRFETNIDTSAAFEQVRQTTLARVNELQPEETLPRSLLYEVARSVNGVIVLNDAVVEPAGDVVPTSGTVIRTRLDLITQSTS